HHSNLIHHHHVYLGYAFRISIPHETATKKLDTKVEEVSPIPSRNQAQIKLKRIPISEQVSSYNRQNSRETVSFLSDSKENHEFYQVASGNLCLVWGKEHKGPI
ncbi:19915_t:CDS:1, partial [Funneliformis geosporum]